RSARLFFRPLGPPFPFPLPLPLLPFPLPPPWPCPPPPPPFSSSAVPPPGALTPVPLPPPALAPNGGAAAEAASIWVLVPWTVVPMLSRRMRSAKTIPSEAIARRTAYSTTACPDSCLSLPVCLGSIRLRTRRMEGDQWRLQGNCTSEV